MNTAKNPANTTNNRRKRNVVRAIFALVIAMILWLMLSWISSGLAWKAVFLDSNQVFFGRFTYVPFSSTITLRDAHYLKPGNDKAEGGALPNLTIVSVEEDAHGPVSKMTIRKSHILYYQKLKPGTALHKGLQEQLAR